ncbi:MAG: hypothetical protein HYS62_01205 [Candidatus Aenigmarchaeota archaeon]|nr:hypothetical protein [Candidatus Aenigmarchaeota archaeon]
MSKAIAVQAIFLIAVIAISLFFIVAIFWGWIDTTEFATNEASCRAARIGCCSALTSGTKDSCDWDSACSEYGVSMPTLQSCCEEQKDKALKPKKC